MDEYTGVKGIDHLADLMIDECGTVLGKFRECSTGNLFPVRGYQNGVSLSINRLGARVEIGARNDRDSEGWRGPEIFEPRASIQDERTGSLYIGTPGEVISYAFRK